MDFDLLYPKRFLKSAQFKGKDVTLTIQKCFIEELEGTKKETKGILAFSETHFQLVLNKTNGLCIKAMFGRETNNWIGKRVTFYPAPFTDQTTGEQTTAIRVRGSPDIAAPVPFTLALFKKKPVNLVMQLTTPRGKGATAARSVVEGQVVTPPAAPQTSAPASSPAPTLPPPVPLTPPQAPIADDGPEEPFQPPTPEEVAAAESLQAADGEFDQ